MTTITTRPEAVRDCPHPGPGPYAETADGRKICDACAADRDREALQAGRPMVAYLMGAESPRGPGAPARRFVYPPAGGAFTVTTWPGVEIGRVWTALTRSVRYTPSGGRYEWYTGRAIIAGVECAVSGPGPGRYLRCRPIRGRRQLTACPKGAPSC